MTTALAIPQSSEPGRISQLLPTVKCSSCNEPVRLAELGDHICPSSSPSSKLASKISRMMSPGPRSNTHSMTRTSFSTTRTRSSSSSYAGFPLAIPPVSSPPLLPKTAPPSQISHHIPPRAPERDHSIPPHLPRTPPPHSRTTPRPIQPPLSRSTTASSGPIPLSSSPVPLSRVGTPQPPPFVSQHPSHSDARNSSTPYLISTHSPRSLPYNSSASMELPPTPTTPHFSQPAPSHHPDSPSFPGSPLPLSPSRRPQQASLGPFGHNPTNSMFSTHGGITRSPEPDTKIGGEAGMAGVGRRGFAAVTGPAYQAGGFPLSSAPSQPYLGGNQPQFLDIAAANQVTPSLHSPTTHSPLSMTPTSDARNVPAGHPDFFLPGGLPSPLRAGPLRGSSTVPKQPSETDHKLPLSSPPSHTRNLSISSDDSEVGLAYARSTSYGDQVEELVTRGQSVRRSRSSSRTRARKDSTSSNTSSSSKGSRGVPQRKNSRGVPGEGRIPPLPSSQTKDLELESAFNAVAALSNADGLSSTLLPPAPSVASSSKPHAPLRSNTVQGLTMPKHEADPYDSFVAKLPMRSNTERASSSNHLKEKTTSALNINKGDSKNRVKVCIGCEVKIQDGRWVQIDGEHGNDKKKGVLCEGCWKGMYLPKCRRCELPIEKHAVSSRDGQLKGKYHKECFTCHECGAPFPNKTFYVFNNQPLCAYHYAKHNNSLCSSTSCGQPIEGPCAVDYKGGRYHPEHFLCMWNRCTEKLDKEYWEVDGKMVCERHAQMQFRQSRVFGNHRLRKSSTWGLSIYGKNGVDDDDDDEESSYDDSEEVDEDSEAWKAMKRTTRFIDLGMLGQLR